MTGSSGLLGTCLLERLHERGETIHTLDLLPAPERGKPRPETRFFQGDAGDEALMTQAARGVEVIYNLAAAQRMKPQFKSWSEQDIYDRNLGSLQSVLHVARREGVRKIVHISSSGIYGVPQQVPCGEDHIQKPLGDYGHSKIACETLCYEAAEQGVDITWFRPMSLFGPEMTGLFVMIYEWVRTGSPVFLLGAGGNRVQTTSAKDVVEACFLAVEKPEASGKCFNLGSDPATVPTVEAMMQGLIDHADTGSRIVKFPAPLLRTAARILEVFNLSPIVPEHSTLADADFILDIRSAQETLGWQPQYDNIEMICEAYDLYIEAGEAVRPPAHPMLQLLGFFFPPRRG